MAEPPPIIPRRLATKDLRDAAAHYAGEVDPATALRFIDAVEQAFALIARRSAQPDLRARHSVACTQRLNVKPSGTSNRGGAVRGRGGAGYL